MRALICGISGQDGAYLARHLLDKGYAVTGTSRDTGIFPGGNLARLGILDRVQLVPMATLDPRSVLGVLRAADADEIYNLSGQSSVGLSFQHPAETLNSIISANLNILEGIRHSGQAGALLQCGIR